MTSKRFTDISNHEGICISLPYYSSAKYGQLELKVLVYEKYQIEMNVVQHSGTQMMMTAEPANHFTIFSPPEESGKYWNNLRMTLIPKASVLQTSVKVDNI